MHHHCFAYVIYSRNENPFVRPTLLTGAANVVLALWLVPRFGVAGLIWSQGLAVGAYINWWAVWRGLKTLNRTPRDYVAALFGREGRHV
jgi:O-antigen/teichoic acid export membrane protein